jgi:hypothetical protein
MRWFVWICNFAASRLSPQRPTNFNLHFFDADRPPLALSFGDVAGSAACALLRDLTQ